MLTAYDPEAAAIFNNATEQRCHIFYEASGGYGAALALHEALMPHLDAAGAARLQTAIDQYRRAQRAAYRELETAQLADRYPYASPAALNAAADAADAQPSLFVMVAEHRGTDALAA